MPVRIYDIAKKLGIESKEVLAKAKALGITAAKVPSSSLDKITAEFLLQEIGGKLIAPPYPRLPRRLNLSSLSLRQFKKRLPPLTDCARTRSTQSCRRASNSLPRRSSQKR